MARNVRVDSPKHTGKIPKEIIHVQTNFNNIIVTVIDVMVENIFFHGGYCDSNTQWIDWLNEVYQVVELYTMI